MPEAFFISRYMEFPEGGSPAGMFRDTCLSMGVEPNYYQGIRETQASSPNFAELDERLRKSECAIIYFGKPSSIDDPMDDYARVVAEFCRKMRKPTFVYASRHFPLEILASSSISVSANSIESKQEFQNQLASDLRKVFAN